ncbi:hypothetical protein NIES4106_59770 (plasmid) [Fischerella sp. NIES-4106]|jgi:hypothetical protein|nr:hypothetical protein NIES4106_59770 [Fischerella sp. NIES-4106]
MSRQLKSQEELENSYIDERVKWLLPQFEALAPYKLKQRKKGVGDLAVRTCNANRLNLQSRHLQTRIKCNYNCASARIICN